MECVGHPVPQLEWSTGQPLSKFVKPSKLFFVRKVVAQMQVLKSHGEKKYKQLKQKCASGSLQLSPVCLLSLLNGMLLQEHGQGHNFHLTLKCQ